MARNIIDAFWDRKNLKRLNDNFFELYNNMLSGTQLEDLKKEINNKLNKGEVSVSDINLALGKIDENFLTQALLDRIDEVKLEDGSVTTEKTNFISKKTSNNLINIENVQLGKNIDSTGAISDRTNYWISDYIPFKYGEQLNFNQSGNALAFYDANKKFITRLGFSGTTYINKGVPSSNYVRIISTSNSNQMMVNKGDVLLPYEEHENTKALDSEIKISLDSLLNYQKSKNLFNKNSVTLNKTLDNNGAIIDDTNWLISNKIKAESKTVSFSVENSVKWGVFDKDNNMLARSGKNSNETTTLNLGNIPNADYFIVSIVKSTKDSFMMNYGDSVLPYEDFKYILTSTSNHPIEISSDIVPKNIQDNANTNSTVVDLANTQQLIKDNNASLDSGENLEILNTTNKTQLDYIEFSSSAVDLELEITYTDKDGQKIVSNIIKPDDNSKLPLTIENVVSYGYPNTDFLVYDVSRKLFKIAIKDLNFSNGVTIKLKNNGTSSINGATKLVGRYYV
ncbi:hypothetical protein BUZ37_01640 [Staphylococcus haemolyticus]|uniref:hypothetical protein n=1 Tax=Staphylococcus haemolyticus TaxID=1283 RepID=UPI000D1D65A9|nr:hypothetical protein [Staphylococcus haemolyticus]PTK55258.1 hypothetical protein BUZ37_01640 [Staphylococcus haemolyticus]